MANQNIRIPRFYTDMPNYLMARGVAQGEFDVKSGGDLISTFTSGSEAELFDMKPLNKCSWDTHSTTALKNDHVLINIDLQSENFKTNYIAILNHNLNSSQGKIRIFAGSAATEIDDVDASGASTGDIDWSNVTVTEVVNADARAVGGSDQSYVIEPATDGSTIIRFTKQSLRYWAIQFEGADGGSGADADEEWDGTTDFYVGNVMVGEYFEMPHAPDLAVKRSIMFDQTKLQESVGGQRYSNMTSFGPQSESGTTKSPFKLASKHHTMYGGRLAYDLNFSYLKSSDVMPLEYASVQYGSDTVVEDIWNITHGSHIPFIFSIDKDSEGGGAESEHIFARFGQNSLDMTQVALDTFNLSLRLEEEI